MLYDFPSENRVRTVVIFYVWTKAWNFNIYHKNTHCWTFMKNPKIKIVRISNTPNFSNAVNSTRWTFGIAYTNFSTKIFRHCLQCLRITFYPSRIPRGTLTIKKSTLRPEPRVFLLKIFISLKGYINFSMRGARYQVNSGSTSVYKQRTVTLVSPLGNKQKKKRETSSVDAPGNMECTLPQSRESFASRKRNQIWEQKLARQASGIF